ncbi:MAG: xanthine dehydrogenase small subunit [Proteobacteria bacterium]|jgi:xanthine dehydrogenase small subunit|nr:xanthine dehydrogenase small subunit [Pseudomonadota bacterium]MDA1293346.1 xanthine dehydrogenase small subunit [Pseudomonadota bacterium]
MDIRFLLNGEVIVLDQIDHHETCLDFLRETRGLYGTKEGCNEGDCGACTVIVIDQDSVKPLNACILFLAQLNGKAIRTVEGIRHKNELHPVQSAMVDKHASQCGFCTPGIVMSLVAGQINERDDHDTVLAGNLCRCTGYAPIIKAANEATTLASPDWLTEDREKLKTLKAVYDKALPTSGDAVAALLLSDPKTRLIAGATDVGLWVTKGLKDVSPAAFLGFASDLAKIIDRDDHTEIGAMVSIETLCHWATKQSPSYAALLRRYGSLQVRSAATLGGNIANGSPIGDNPPALIAAGAELCLRQGETRRSIPLEAFFLDYGKQDLKKGEFVESILVPKNLDRLGCYKISKRFDQDISALCGCFNIKLSKGVVHSARIAFGGMAGIPKRASHVESALIGQPWTDTTLSNIEGEWAKDFTPLSDARASAGYRLKAAHRLLLRYFHEREGQKTDVLEVRP